MIVYRVAKVAQGPKSVWQILSLYPGGKVLPRQALYKTEAEGEAVIDGLLEPRDAFKIKKELVGGRILYYRSP